MFTHLRPNSQGEAQRTGRQMPQEARYQHVQEGRLKLRRVRRPEEVHVAHKCSKTTCTYTKRSPQYEVASRCRQDQKARKRLRMQT